MEDTISLAIKTIKKVTLRYFTLVLSLKISWCRPQFFLRTTNCSHHGLVQTTKLLNVTQ